LIKKPESARLGGDLASPYCLLKNSAFGREPLLAALKLAAVEGPLCGQYRPVTPIIAFSWSRPKAETNCLL
jgi:hypothetical protein